MLISSWLRSVQAKVQLASMRRRRRSRRDTSKTYRDLRLAETLEDRSLLTALIIDPTTYAGGAINIDNASMAGFDAIVIDSLSLTNTLNAPGINIDLSGIALDYITIDSTSVTGGNEAGIVINLVNITGGVDDIVIDTATVSGNALDAIEIAISGTDVGDLSIAHSDISGAVDIDVMGGAIDRLSASESSFVHTTASLSVSLDGTDLTTFILSDSTVEGGAVVEGMNATMIGHGYVVRNEITGMIGESGIRMTMADSFVDDFIIAENTKINSVTEDGILIDFNNTPGDGLKILNNTFATDPSVAMDLTIDGDTFSSPFEITNNASVGQRIAKVTLDISPTGLVFDEDPFTGLPFTPLNGTEVTTGFSAPAVVGGNGDQLILDFTNFDPGEVLQFLLDVDFVNDPNDLSPVYGDDLIGSIVTIEFDDGTTSRTITGLLVADPNSRDAARFAAAQSGSGGNGVRLELNKSGQSNVWIDANTIEGNSGGGIIFNNVESDIVDGVISNNQINATQHSGLEFNLVDSAYSGALLNNTVGGHVEHGVVFNPSVNISGDVLDADNSSEIVITSIGHGLTNGETVVIGGVTGNVKANGVHTVTVITPNEFRLNGVDGTQVGVDTERFEGGGTWFRVAPGEAGDITGATFDPAGIVEIEITSAGHGLTNGDSVTIAGVLGNLAANGTHTVTVVDPDRFTLNGVTGTGVYEPADISNPGGGYWFQSFTIDFQSTPDRVIRGNNFNTNGLAGMMADLPQGTVFNATLHSNIVDANNRFGLDVTTNAGVFDLDVGSRVLEPDGRPTHRNLFQRNVGAGIALKMNDSGSGSYDIANNSFIAQLADANNAIYDGDGINVRMLGTQGAAAATALLSTSVIEGNVFGVDSRGNAGSGVDFYMQEDTRIQILEVRGNSFLNNGDDGFKFFRRDDAVLDEVLIVDNTFENNASDGADLTAINTTIDPLDFVLTDNVITKNGALGVRMLLQADARIAADFNNNLIDQNNSGGLDITAVQQIEIELNLLDNVIRNNLGDGIHIQGVDGVVNAIVRMQNITDPGSPPLQWRNNVVTGNLGDGLDMNNIAFGTFDWVNNRFDNNANPAANNDGHGISIRGSSSVIIEGLQNTFSGNEENGLDLGGGFSLTLGDGTVPNQNVVENNGNDGFLVQGGSIEILADQNVVQRNGGDGFDLEVGNYRVELNDVVIFENGLDGIELEARFGSHNSVSPTGGNNTLLVTNSRITFNDGRGVDVLNEGDTDSDVHLRTNRINSNGLSGVFVVNTSATDQVQIGPADEGNFSQTGDYRRTPNIDLHVIDNEIQSNGVPASRGGLVIWVGTADSDGAVATNAFNDVAFGQQVQLAGAKIRSEVLNNSFEGNFGSDVYIQPFRSTIDPPTTAGIWNNPSDPPYRVDLLWRDPLARLDMAFRGNTGDSLDVTNIAPFYNNAEGVFKSRLNSADPAGPFTSATRPRNATKTVGSSIPFAGPGADFGYDGIGLSTFRVEVNPDDGPAFFQDTSGFGFSDYDDQVGSFPGGTHLAWDRVPVGSVFTISPDAFDSGGNSNDSSATAVNLGTQGQISLPSLNIHNATDEDWFRAFAFMDGPMTAEILFGHALGDLDFEVYDAGDLVNPIAASASVTDDEVITIPVTTGQELYFRIFGFAGASHPDYQFNLDIPVTPDALENNDGSLSATFLGTLGTTTLTGLNITDDDWYEFISAGTTVQIDATFLHAGGDLNVELYDSADLVTPVASALSGTDNESITFAAGAGVRYFVRVFEQSQQPGILHSGYDLTVQSTGVGPDAFEVNDTQGQAHNFSDPNNSGTSTALASIDASANIHVAGNDDWYRFEAATAGTHTFTLLFDDAQGDLGFQVVNISGVELGSSTARSGVGNNFESVDVLLAAGADYWIRVIGANFSPGYRLVVGAPSEDGFEQNDTRGTAASLGGFGQTNATHKIFRNLSIDTPGDDDFYSVTPASAGSLHVRLRFEQSLGDLNVEIQDGAGNILATGTSAPDSEAANLTGITPGATYIIRVFGVGGATHPDYTLDVETSTGGPVANGPTPGGGGTSGAPIPSTDDAIRSQIILANQTAGEQTITLPAGTYSLDKNGQGEDLSLTGDLDITDDLIIIGAGAGSTIIDGSMMSLLDRVFHIHPGVRVTFENLTISGGDGTNGGAIRNEGTLTLNNVTLTDNRSIIEGGAIDNFGVLNIDGGLFEANVAAGPGGAIYNTGTLDIVNTVFRNNEAFTFGGSIYNTGTVTIDDSQIVDGMAVSGGGAVFNAFGGTLTVTSTEISRNDSISQGGAILNAGTMTLNTVGLSGNTASSRGGAIFDEGTSTIVNSTLDHNHANARGGAIYMDASATLTALNTTISTNTTASRGAGIFTSGTLSLTNVTVTANAAESRGGGLYVEAGTSTLLNTIVAQNTANLSGVDVEGSVDSAGNNLIGITDDSTGFDAMDLTGTASSALDPILGPLAHNPNVFTTNLPAFILTHDLPDPNSGSVSPAMDAGNNSVRTAMQNFFAPPLDNRLSPRFIDGDDDQVHTIDIGAVEYHVNQPTAVFTASPNPAAPNELITLDGNLSYHTNADAILTYEWDLDNDGDFDDFTGAVATHSFPQFTKGTPNIIRLRVTDENGIFSTSSESIVVDQGNTAPFANPGGPYVLDDGDNLQLDGSGSTDNEIPAGDLIVSYEWDLDDDGVFDDATGVTPLITSAQLTTLGLNTTGNYPVALRVTDCFGLTDTASVTLSVVEIDYGDAPVSYGTLAANNGARHTINPAMFLGAAIDSEDDGFPGATATGDDNAGTDDEDGVTFGILETHATLPVAATTTVVASLPGKVDVWIDYNEDGAFDSSEHINAGLSFDVEVGSNELNFSIPAGTTAGSKVARVRYSTLGGLNPTGRAADGEVEDYIVTITTVADPVTPTILRPNSPAVNPVTTDLTPTIAWTPHAPNLTHELRIIDVATGTDVVNVSGLMTTSYTPTFELVPGTYNVIVTAFNRAGIAASPTPDYFFDVVKLTLTGPIGATANPRPDITWNAVNGSSRYELRVDSLSDGTIGIIDEQNLAGDTTSFTPTADFGLGTYQAVLRAYDANGEPGDFADVLIFQVKTPVIVTAPLGNTPDSTPTFTWTPVLGAVTYRLVVDNLSTGQVGVINESTLITTTYTPTVALPVGIYRTTVTAVNTANETSNPSEPTTFVVATAPRFFSPGKREPDSTPTFTWSNVAVANRYELWVRNLSTGQDQVIYQTNLTNNAYTSPVELPLGRYRAWVRANIDDPNNINTNWSAGLNFEITAAPTILRPDVVTYNGLPTFRWTAPVGADSYEIWVTDLSREPTGEYTKIISLTDLTSTTYVPVANDLENGLEELGIGRYRVWVRAFNSADLSFVGDWSVGKTFKIATRPVMLAPAGRIADATPTISWEGVAGAESYEVWVDNRSTGEEQVFFQTGVEATSITVNSDLEIGQHRAWVRGVNAAGEKSAWSRQIDFFVSPAPVITGPSGSSFDRTPVIAWNAVAGAAEYDLWLNYTSGGQPQFIRRDGITGTSFAPSTALPDGDFTVWVRGINANDEAGDWSNPQVFTVGGRPTLDQIATSNDTTPTFTWQPIGQANSYRLQVNEVGGTPKVIFEQNLTNTSYTSALQLAPGNYRAWVQAISVTGELSAWSVAMDFTIVAASDSAFGPLAPQGDTQAADVLVPTDKYEILPVGHASNEIQIVGNRSIVEEQVVVTAPAQTSADAGVEITDTWSRLTSVLPAIESEAIDVVAESADAEELDEVLAAWPDTDWWSDTQQSDQAVDQRLIAAGLLAVTPLSLRSALRRDRQDQEQ